MSLQEVILYMVWLLVYIFAGKMIIDDLYINNKKVKGLFWIFWCPLLIATIILWLTEELIDWIRIKINIKK
jgi:hypothetical protein